MTAGTESCPHEAATVAERRRYRQWWRGRLDSESREHADGFRRDGWPGEGLGGRAAQWALCLTRVVTAPILWARVKTCPERRKPAPISKSMVIVS